MRRFVVGFGAMVALAAVAALGGSASASDVRHCSGFTYRPLQTPIRHVTARHLTCTAARGIARTYMLATSSTTTRTGVRQGRCFPSHVYGACRIVYRKHRYRCYHNNYGEGVRGGVRCTRPGHAASFRLPS